MGKVPLCGIRSYSLGILLDTAKRLCILLEHERPFNFDEDCLKAFGELKKALVTEHVVIPLDWSLPFELMCDASDHSVGAVLGQKKNKIFYSIIMLIKPLSMPKSITTVENELLAVVFAFDKFRVYLIGTKVTVYTNQAGYHRNIP